MLKFVKKFVMKFVKHSSKNRIRTYHRYTKSNKKKQKNTNRTIQKNQTKRARITTTTQISSLRSSARPQADGELKNCSFPAHMLRSHKSHLLKKLIGNYDKLALD